MTDTIDCLFIGHNEISFENYEKRIRAQGINSGAYRNLNLSFLRYNNKLCHISDIFNQYFSYSDSSGQDSPTNRKLFLSLGDTFSPAIAYLGSYLYRRGFSFDYINSFQNEKNELIKKLSRGNILTIAITTTLYFDAFPILEIIDIINKYNRTARVIVGGPFILSQELTLDKLGFEFLLESIGADFYVRSFQGEGTLVKIISTLKKNVPPDFIENIYYKSSRGYKGTPRVTEDNKLSENMVKWELFSDRSIEYVGIRTTISCPFSCSFCLYPVNAGKYQTVGVAAVEEELNQIARWGTVKSVDFIDDTLNVPQKRFKEILRMMIKNKYDFSWHSYFRCQFTDREMLELMKESKCEGVFLGLESANNQILKNMNKQVTVEQYLKGIALLKEYDILVFGSFIVGFPGETEETLKDSIRLIEESGIDFYQLKQWYYDPNAPIKKDKEKYGLKGSNYEWTHNTMNAKTARDMVDQMILSLDRSIWCPEYNFSFGNLFHLIYRGMSMERVKQFLGAFTDGIKEKLMLPGLSAKEVSSEVLRRMKDACQPDRCPGGPLEKNEIKIGKYNAEFNF